MHLLRHPFCLPCDVLIRQFTAEPELANSNSPDSAECNPACQSNDGGMRWEWDHDSQISIDAAMYIQYSRAS